MLKTGSRFIHREIEDPPQIKEAWSKTADMLMW